MPKGIGIACRGLLTPRDTHHLRIFSAWAVAATAGFAGTLLAIGEDGPVGPTLGWVLVAATGLLMVMAVRAYLRFIRTADELLRKIQLDALAVGFGAGAVFMLCYRLLERLGARQLPISAPFVVMMCFWALGQYLGMRRFMAEGEL